MFELSCHLPNLLRHSGLYPLLLLSYNVSATILGALRSSEILAIDIESRKKTLLLIDPRQKDSVLLDSPFLLHRGYIRHRNLAIPGNIRKAELIRTLAEVGL